MSTGPRRLPAAPPHLVSSDPETHLDDRADPLELFGCVYDGDMKAQISVRYDSHLEELIAQLVADRRTPWTKSGEFTRWAMECGVRWAAQTLNNRPILNTLHVRKAIQTALVAQDEEDKFLELRDRMEARLKRLASEGDVAAWRDCWAQYEGLCKQTDNRRIRNKMFEMLERWKPKARGER